MSFPENVGLEPARVVQGDVAVVEEGVVALAARPVVVVVPGFPLLISG